MKRIVLLMLIACACGPPAVQAQQRPKFQVQVEVGFNGLYKVGAWTPVSVTITGPRVQGLLRLHTADADDVNSIVSRKVQVDGQPKQLFVRFGGAFPTLRVELIGEGGGRVFSREFENREPSHPLHLPSAMLSSQELIVTLGGSVGLERMAAQQQARDNEELAVARLDDAGSIGQLPNEWFGYEGVDLLVLTTSNPVLYKGGARSQTRWQAIREWVENGGRLVILGGRTGDVRELFLAGDNVPLKDLADLLPCAVRDEREVYSLGSLETYCGAAKPVRFARLTKDPDSRRGLRMPFLAGIDGAVDESQDEKPLIVRAPTGFGEVIFLPLNLDTSPLSLWEDRTKLWFKLLSKTPKDPAEADEENQTLGEVGHLGISDLAGQLKASLDQFAGISLVPFMLVAMLALVYIVLIGPVDYLLVKKVFRRPVLTWVTFPVTVLVVSYAAYELAYYLKGGQLRLNQVDVVDVDLTSGHTRGQSWFNVFSPDSRTYNVTVAPPSLGDESPAKGPSAKVRSIVSWLGLPGDAMGGMDRSGSPGLFSGRYAYSPSYDAMGGVPIQVWSSKSFTARWSAQADRTADLGLQVELSDGGGTLTSTLPHSLSDCWLVLPRDHDVEVAPIGKLAPGVPVTFSNAGNQSLADVIKGTHVVRDDEKRDIYRTRTRVYDPSGYDVVSILRLMTFYRVPGQGRLVGEAHTELLHRYQSHVDLSHHVNGKLNRRRAVLIGFAEASAARVGLGMDDAKAGNDPLDKHQTCYRFIFEINRDE